MAKNRKPAPHAGLPSSQTMAESLRVSSDSLSQPPSAKTTPPGSGSEAEELKSYVYRNVLKAGGALLLILVLVGVVGIRYKPELESFTIAVYEALGVFGLSLILFLSDAVTSPVPPDAILLVVANSPLQRHWVLVVSGLGFVSVLAGNLGYAIGARLSNSRWPRTVFGRFRTKKRRLVERYGKWGVALGALTPVPFSFTCWTAGLLHMRWAPFAAVSLLRLPRLFVYYLAIAHAEQILRWLF